MSKTLMVNRNATGAEILVRTPVEKDQPGIMDLAERCEPFLTRHGSYIFYLYLHCNADTCRVAEVNHKIIGYCSVIPVSGYDNRYFFHQIGVDLEYRRYGVAQALILEVLGELRARAGAFELEFTVNQANKRVLLLFKATARIAGMQDCRSLGLIELFDETVREELYLMTFPRLEPDKSEAFPSPRYPNPKKNTTAATWSECHSAATGLYD
jgi:ribosomal protein S18 acetylase RimI-like enzyme